MGRETLEDIAKGELNTALLEEQRVFEYIDRLKEQGMAVMPDSAISYIMKEFNQDFDLSYSYLKKWRKENEEE